MIGWVMLGCSQELFLESDKLEFMNAALGSPLPPQTAVRCPTPFFRDLDCSISSDPARPLCARYAFDLQTHSPQQQQGGGAVEAERYSQTFMTGLLRAVQGCLTHDQYSAQTRQLGVAVLNPLLDGVQSLCRTSALAAASCVVTVDNALNSEASAAIAVARARNALNILCEECLARFISKYLLLL